MAPRLYITDWFPVVFHPITTWDGSMNATQRTTKEWFEWANAQNLQLGSGAWGNSDHGWQSAVVYPSGHVVEGTGDGRAWASLQNGNVGHAPWTSPTWWTEVAEPDIGADSALFTAVQGTTKMSGWDHVLAGKLSGHLYTQGAGVNTLVYSSPVGVDGQFIGASPGVAWLCVRMSLTEDTCYALYSETDGYGATDFSFYKVTSGALSLIHAEHVAGEWGGEGIRFCVAGSRLSVETVLTAPRTTPAFKAVDPLKWQEHYVELCGWTDPSPIPAAGHEYVGFRVHDGTGYQVATHEAFGGGLTFLSAAAGAVVGGVATLSGTRAPGSTVTVTRG